MVKKLIILSSKEKMIRSLLIDKIFLYFNTFSPTLVVVCLVRENSELLGCFMYKLDLEAVHKPR